jgi:hypothetical protein
MKTTTAFILFIFASLLFNQQAHSQCTTVLLKPGAAEGIHAHISDNHPTQNYNHDSAFMAMHWTILGVPVESRGLLKFDLNQIPIGATVTGAKLNLYADTTSLRSSPHQPTFGSNNACYLKGVTEAWDRDIVTWNTQPATTSAGQILLSQSQSYTQNYLNLDVTNFAQQWVNNPNTNYGLLLEMITTNYYNSMIFCSSDFGDSTRWPSLEICYIPQPPCNTVADFTYHHTGGGQVSFTNTSTSDSGYYSSWVFYNSQGIIDVSNLDNPIITYTGTEPFFASLTVTDSAFASCYNTTVQMINIVDCIIIQPGAKDGYHAHITSLHPTLNYGQVEEFMSIEWTDSGVPYEARGLMKFDVTAVPPGSTIVSAFLDMYADTTSTSSYPGQPMFGNTNASNLLKITAPWTKNTVTWNNQPATTTVNEVLLGQMRGDINYLRVDVAPFVQDWVNAPAQNYGMLLDMISTASYNAMIFCSSDHPDSTLWPVLTVCYISGGLNASAEDTLCGFVFNDANNDGVYNSGDGAEAHAVVMVDGAVYYTGNDGYYHVIVPPGNHSLITVPLYGQSQTFPTPNTYSITTSGGQGICGFDFGLNTGGVSGIDDLNRSNAMAIYPNPVTGNSFNLIVAEDFNEAVAAVSLTDMLGRQMSLKITNSTKAVLTIELQPGTAPGIYLVSATANDQRLESKISVLR